MICCQARDCNGRLIPSPALPAVKEPEDVATEGRGCGEAGGSQEGGLVGSAPCWLEDLAWQGHWNPGLGLSAEGGLRRLADGVLGPASVGSG